MVNSTQGAPVTASSLRKLKQQGQKFACLTAYDASFAQQIDAAGIELILVGDSLGMVVQGQKTTLPVTLEEMIYHTQAVARGSQRALIMADMPFMADVTEDEAVRSAMRLVKHGGAHAVKFEGGMELEPIIKRLARAGVPVCAHLGLLPQQVNKLGGYKVQGRDEDQAALMIDTATVLEDAGADFILLECVVQSLAEAITQAVTIPVIGIGAGNAVDAQVLVCYDMLGITPGKRPRFSKDFLAEAGSFAGAFALYHQQVVSGQFPAAEHAFD